MAKTRRRVVYRKKTQNRLSMVLAIIVMLVILGAVSVRGFQLRTQLAGYNARKEELQQQIAAEEKRTGEIEEYSKYTKTDEYVEEVARDKLGLVKQGEIIFRNTGKAADSTASGTGSSAVSGSAGTTDMTGSAAASDATGTAAAPDSTGTADVTGSATVSGTTGAADMAGSAAASGATGTADAGTQTGDTNQTEGNVEGSDG